MHMVVAKTGPRRDEENREYVATVEEVDVSIGKRFRARANEQQLLARRACAEASNTSLVNEAFAEQIFGDDRGGFAGQCGPSFLHIRESGRRCEGCGI